MPRPRCYQRGYVVAAYREGRVTMNRAAEMASLSVWNFMARMEAAGLRSKLLHPIA